jgi:hypothetical protein
VYPLSPHFRCWLLAALVVSSAGCGTPPEVDRPGPGATSLEEARQIGRALTTRVGPPPGGFPVARTAAGAHIVDLKGRFSEVAVVGRAPDGTLRTACVSSAKEAESFLAATATAPDAGR